MGLLSNPKTREKIVGVLKNHGNKLCILCYVAGLVWFFALAYKPLNAGTYFSENALLPGKLPMFNVVVLHVCKDDFIDI